MKARREWRTVFMFLIPALAVLVVGMGYPTIFSIYNSLYRWLMFRPDLGKSFIGLSNYIDILQSPTFWNAVRITFIIVFLSTGLTFIIGLVEAQVVSEIPKWRGLFSTALTIPLAVTPVVVSLAWRFMYHERTGLITAYLLPLLGIRPETILGDPSIAIFGVIAADVWNTTPLVFLIFLAGIQSLPREPYEAAKIDGASYWQTLRHITLPQLKTVFLITLILRTIDTFKLFDLPWAMTMRGGPGISTRNLVIDGYLTAFTAFDMGRASAYSIIIMYIVMGVSMVYIKFLLVRGKS